MWNQPPTVDEVGELVYRGSAGVEGGSVAVRVRVIVVTLRRGVSHNNLRVEWMLLPAFEQ